MSLGVRFGRLPEPASRLLYPVLRYTNLMRALEMRHLGPWIREVGDWRVLDVGCGHGLYSLALPLQGATLVGCDLSPSSLKAAHQTAQGIGLNSRAAYVVADGAKLPLRKEHYDLVVCNCVLEHIIDDRSALAEMRRALKPGGLLYLAVDNADHSLRLSFLEHLSPSTKTRLLRHEIAEAPTVAQGLDKYLAVTYAVQRRYHEADLAEVLQNLGFDLLGRHVYLSRLGAIHFEAFHLFRGLDIDRRLGRLAYMLTSLLFYPLVTLVDHPEDRQGYGLVFVARKAGEAKEHQDPGSQPPDPHG